MKHKEPTWTTRVLETLRAQDDFMDYRALLAALRVPNAVPYTNRICAACIHLRKRRAIDCVIEPSGVAWWYALPEESDDRLFHCDERTPESRPRRPRKTKQRRAP